MFSPTTDLSKATLDSLATDFDHHSEQYRSHSIDILMHMQKQCPFVHSNRYGGFWVATKANDCLEVAKNAEAFSSSPTDQIPDLEPTRMIPLYVDPPDLYDYRALLLPLFSPSKVAQIESYVRNAAERRMVSIKYRGGGDLTWDYALPMTGMVTLKLAGFDPDDWPYYAPPLHELIYSGRPMEERLAGMKEMIERMRKEVRRLKNEPVPGGVIEYLYNVEMAGRKLRLDEIDSVVLIMLGGGLDTTQALFGMMAVYLGRNPERRQELIDDPALRDNAIEEFLRVFPPTQGVARRATKEVTVAGKTIKPEERVFISFTAANRDPAEYENPHTIDFRRKDIHHYSFGVGPHRCLGSHLARLEARTLLDVLLEQAPHYRLVEEDVKLSKDIGTIAGFKQIQIKV